MNLLIKRSTSFSHFYHPCKFNLKLQSNNTHVCALSKLVNLYRSHGHHYAKLDPLGIYNKQTLEFIRPTDLGITFQDVPSTFKFKSYLTDSSNTIEELENNLKRVYQSSMGVEFSHINLLQEQEWLYENYEKVMLDPVSNEIKVRLAKTLVEAESVDLFLHKKFVTFKRYSGEGAESTIVALEHLFELAGQSGVEHIVFGMPHRGRLNLLLNILDYQGRYLFRKIAGKTDTPSDQLHQVIDDVTSHVAQSVTKTYNQKNVKITLVHNPSHLQAQNPVSMGKTRSKQHIHGHKAVLNIQVHGDAAFCAQGIVYESLCLGKTPKFDVGGTIHLITNNQIGYTTRPIDSRPSKYATDVCKAFDIPILHVNSQNIEDVYRAVKLAVTYQRQFGKDILIDLICYRKYGHNEVDQPQFTQPKMYNKIRKNHTPNTKKYSELLAKEGLVESSFYQTQRDGVFERLEKEFVAAQTIPKVTLKDYTNPGNLGAARAFTECWKGFKPSQLGQQSSTAFDINTLRQFAKSSLFLPPSFSLHARIQKYHFDARLKSLSENKLDWATCQMLALFSLSFQGYNIRMSGQDVERGTFSQRHINLTDQKTEQTFNPLQFFASQHPGRGKVQIFNSALTENAAMSYEYGYSLDHPNNLAIWEAQFGDFYNTAQVVVDVFLTNSENKWLRQSSLTLILPHGFDGAGPQHSSCRIERFLQLANSDGSLTYRKLQQHNQNRASFSISEDSFVENIQQANFSLISPTKPANIFHALRRQMKRNFRKPLIISGPKSLLRLNDCVSTFEDLGPNSKFEPILKYINADKIQSCDALFICAGKYVYDIQNYIKEKNSSKTGLLTIEELFPFPQAALQKLLETFSKNGQVYWIQEQNLNGGGYEFCSKRINRVLKNLGIVNELKYVGRRAIAATAVGSSQLHKKEGEALKKWINDLIV